MDRNSIVLASFRACITSLSARRAWIEIKPTEQTKTLKVVALRKESVDRNIRTAREGSDNEGVALRKESVDRNSIVLASFRACITSLSARRAWIEICPGRIWSTALAWSLSARRAWIEIIDYIIDYATDAVALRKESVDRNTSFSPASLFGLVALRKESVDRNRACITTIIICTAVALRKESVDRNRVFYWLKVTEAESLSARRAWIEISCTC